MRAAPCLRVFADIILLLACGFPFPAQVADILEGLMSGSYGPKVDPADAAAHLYVWLRYSANRHITWQRNYNTQPRILSAAQVRAGNAPLLMAGDAGALARSSAEPLPLRRTASPIPLQEHTQ